MQNLLGKESTKTEGMGQGEVIKAKVEEEYIEDMVEDVLEKGKGEDEDKVEEPKGKEGIDMETGNLPSCDTVGLKQGVNKE